MTNTKLYVGIGVAVFVANTAYHVVNERISSSRLLKVEADLKAQEVDNML